MIVITPSGHIVRVHPYHHLLRPDDAAEQARFSQLAAEGGDDLARSLLRHADRMQRLHMANREVAIREQAI